MRFFISFSVFEFFQFLHFLLGNFDFFLTGTEFQFIYRKFLNLLFVVYFDNDFDSLAKNIYILYSSLNSIRKCDSVPDSRKFLIQLLVCFLFVLETAHQSAAYAGNLGLVQ